VCEALQLCCWPKPKSWKIWLPHQNSKERNKVKFVCVLGVHRWYSPANQFSNFQLPNGQKIQHKKSVKAPQNTPNYYPFLIEGTKGQK
jgi:hypothetical protein